MRPTARWRAHSGLAAAITAAALIYGRTATAQNGVPTGSDPDCVLDKCLHSTPTPSTPDTPEPSGGGFARAGTTPASGAFDFYVLSLSWSPAFCQTPAAEHASTQCEPGARLGFVVHGLWPQNQHGYPSNCDSAAGVPSRMALQSVHGLYPDEGLARHEWRMHGTCTGKSPTDYFADVRRARDSITIPQPFQAPDSDARWTPIDVARAFMTANRGLRLDSMAVTCRRDAIEEVRICFSKDLRGFVSCPEVARASCRRPVEVPPVL
jgi:ribonuclease T2